MDFYKGIPIAEYKLLMLNIIFTALFVALLVAAFYLYASLNRRSKKDVQRIKNLSQKAKTDDAVRAQLERLERKNKRKRKRNRESIIFDIIVWGLIVVIGVAALSCAIIPTWTDYIVKDYVVYTGEIRVYRHMRYNRIELEDGTILTGGAEFTEQDTNGTLVYSKRSKIVLGEHKS